MRCCDGLPPIRLALATRFELERSTSSLGTHQLVVGIARAVHKRAKASDRLVSACKHPRSIFNGRAARSCLVFFCSDFAALHKR